MMSRPKACLPNSILPPTIGPSGSGPRSRAAHPTHDREGTPRQGGVLTQRHAVPGRHQERQPQGGGQWGCGGRRPSQRKGELAGEKRGWKTKGGDEVPQEEAALTLGILSSRTAWAKCNQGTTYWDFRCRSATCPLKKHVHLDIQKMKERNAVFRAHYGK